MRRVVGVRLTVGIAIASVLAAAAACGIGNGGRATSGGDDGGATGDGSSSDGEAGALGCPTVTCNGACVASCDGCDAGTAMCPSTRACGHCDTCGGSELECFACAGGSGPPTAFCSTLFDKCNIAPADHCACEAGTPTTCPGKLQICTLAGAQCFSCGEDGSQGITCGNGLQCVFDPKPGCTGS